MNVKNRLRNNLVRRIQRLSTEKLKEITALLGKIENQFKSKDKTLKMAGTWRELGDDFGVELTEQLHDNRLKDREIN